jgi:hypothetical protein
VGGEGFRWRTFFSSSDSRIFLFVYSYPDFFAPVTLLFLYIST